MAKVTNKRTKVLLSFLIGLLIVAYRVVFRPPLPLEEEIFDANTVAIERVENMLDQIEDVDFDTSIIDDPAFQSLKSIESPLISLPVGKTNPFSAN